MLRITANNNYLHTKTVRSTSFSIGYQFYYWPKYKDMDDIGYNRIDNINDHSGYKVSELYIPQKYETFKEEISNYEYFDMNCYYDLSKKINSYMENEWVKSFKPRNNSHLLANWPEIRLFYDIDQESRISFNHLLSLVLYTDYSDLSTHFSSTFRAIHQYEQLSSVRVRNANYWWMSKSLRELVELYGSCGAKGDFTRNNNGCLSGPFCM